MGDRGRRREDDVDCIEANVLPGDIRVAGKFVRGTDQASAFLGANRAVRRAVFIRLTGFHFNEYQAIAFPADEVDFASTRSHAIVAGDDSDPIALQVTVSDVFAPAAQSVVRSEMTLPGVLPENIGELIQATHHS
jgi:hypothetical protein